VFISYAHSPETRDLVRRLVEVLRANRTTVIWDGESLRDGESISLFIDSVRTVPVLIPVFSDRYPRSPCYVSEMFAFFESCGSDRSEFSRRTVPLVLGGRTRSGPRQRNTHPGREPERVRSVQTIRGRCPQTRPEPWERVSPVAES
jgi:hypothetical protein